MSSLPPPSQKTGIPPSGGNGKYIAVAAILLLGIGAIAYWKLHATPPAPPPPIPIPTASTVAENPKIDDVPPPPPEPDGGEDAAPKVTVVHTGGGGGGCGVTVCNGNSSPQMVAGLTMLARQTRRKCYEPALANDPSLQGHVMVKLKISSGGQICSATVQKNDMGSSQVADCAARMLLISGRVPPPKGGCVNVDFPINYVAAGH